VRLRRPGVEETVEFVKLALVEVREEFD